MTIREFCRGILESGSLQAKLTPPPEAGLADPTAEAALAPLLIDRPIRAAGLELRAGAGPLPRAGALHAAPARAVCLARFAHHELMAVELFAWALLRWPELPLPLRRGLLGVLADEQRHCRLYLQRLHAHGSQLSDHLLSDYFWKHLPAIDASPHGPSAFLCAMGLTFEQANLDFTLLYRDGFREAGDEASAEVCQLIHDDEVEHVRMAARCLRALAPQDEDDVETYRRAVPFPLSAARAKGRRFQAESRRRAGLSARFIAFVRDARSTQEQFPSIAGR
jgi:uncharacterized ferritin-like protein (DUF455 family)